MSTVEQRPITAEEFARMANPPDGAKQELVRGEVVTMPPPGLDHGEYQTNVATLLKTHAKARGAGRVFTESGVVTERNADSVRGPDVSYYSPERLPPGVRVQSYHEQPPDLCVEIMSPHDSRKALRAKVKEYLFCGVRLVWVVDPDDRTVTVYREPHEGRILDDAAEIDGADVVPGFRCRVADFFDS